MALRLSNFFEDRMEKIMHQWKAARKRMFFETIRRRKSKPLIDLNMPGTSKDNAPDNSASEIESEDHVGEHLKLSILQSNLKQNGNVLIVIYYLLLCQVRNT